jgi:hypothetical protein
MGETLDELLIMVHDSVSLYLGEEEPERLLTRVTGWQLEIESDLRPVDVDDVTRPPARRKRQSHREDWPPEMHRP